MAKHPRALWVKQLFCCLRICGSGVWAELVSAPYGVSRDPSHGWSLRVAVSWWGWGLFHVTPLPTVFIFQGFSLRVASLDFFTWWLAQNKEKLEAADVSSSGTHFYHIHLTKESIEASPGSRGRQTDTTFQGEMRKNSVAMISNVLNIPIEFSGGFFYHPCPALPAKVPRLYSMQPRYTGHEASLTALEGCTPGPSKAGHETNIFERIIQNKKVISVSVVRHMEM